MLWQKYSIDGKIDNKKEDFKMAERIMMTPQELNDGAVFLRQRMEAMNEEVASMGN